MTSVNTNSAAITALRTLQETNKDLDATQSRISTGLRIGEAKDNAAYWAISTTLQSDNKSMATVKDALGLGSATVDTAYQGLTKAKDVLDEIKSKLTAATQAGVDKEKIQTEIAELQNQLKSIADSSVFSGENWLSVNSDIAGYNGAKSVVASFSRDGNNAVSIGTIDVDISSIALVDGSVLNEGILDAGKVGNALTGGLQVFTSTAGVTATAGSLTQGAAFAYNDSATPATDTLAFDVVIDTGAGTATFNVAMTDYSTFDTAAKVVSRINTAIGSRGFASEVGGVITIRSAATGLASQVAIANVTPTGGAMTAGLVNGAGTAGIAGVSGTALATAEFTTPITLDGNDTLAFDVAANGNPARSVLIDRATIDAVLTKAVDGRISTASQFQAVVQRAVQNAGVPNVTVSLTASAIRLTSTLTGVDSAIAVTNFETSRGANILDLDVSEASVSDITRAIKNVNDAINKVTTAASTLGSVAKRIDLQETFVNGLMDTIDKGIGNLIDADMSEESTRLQALQVKQQLGVQALSIANQSAQNVLRLFQ